MLTDLHLSQIMRNASQAKRAACLAPLNKAMATYAIDTLKRAAAFIAQLAHESGEFRYMEEIWGPTDAQKRYEPTSTLAKRLGNSKKGDGKLFKGRGPIQVTGRYNYQAYGDLLGINLIAEPQRAATPEIGFEIAGLYWQHNGLNAIADAGDFKKVTQRINGGQNGAAAREAYYERALRLLASAFPAAAKRSKQAAPPAPAEQLGRGHEAIIELASAPKTKPKTSKRPAKARLDARPDTLDFRDLMYTPTLIEVPTHVPLGDYLEYSVPILDQGSEGACTGFGLATVAHYLLLRRRIVPDNVAVSPRMVYHLARRYDEWAGEDYSGSSARGAMKGWHKHGICSEQTWSAEGGNAKRSVLTDALTSEARQRPLGAYFRVNHKDLVAMHSAIAEVGVLYASATVHRGWMQLGADGLIEHKQEIEGGHAFAIVAYDDEGFWIQNSWGSDWGAGGFGRISYDDWLENGTDAWVARLGAPVTLRSVEAVATAYSPAAAQSTAYSYADLRPHIVSIGNDGTLKAGGDYGSTREELANVFNVDIPRVTKDWATPRILLYAHGGLVSEAAAVQRLAEYRPTLLDQGVYPLAFIWRSDYWTTIGNILRDAVRRRRPEGALDATKDFMLDRLDDALEPVARALTGKSVWDEMKENALAASASHGAATLVADHLAALVKNVPGLEIHLVGHSAGSILHAPLIKLLGERKLPIRSCTLWAPACTVELFEHYYMPALKSKLLAKLAIFALRDEIERDDNCAGIYNKSLLYLVSNAFEKTPRIPVFRNEGVPILGMERGLDALVPKLKSLGADVVYTPNDEPPGSIGASEARHHGDFDDDEKTVQATFARILSAELATAPAGRATAKAEARVPTPSLQSPPAAPKFRRSTTSMREQRRAIEAATKPTR